MARKPRGGIDPLTGDKVDETHPFSLVSFLIAAIDEVAPGHGRAVYFRAVERFEAYATELIRKEAQALRPRARPEELFRAPPLRYRSSSGRE